MPKTIAVLSSAPVGAHRLVEMEEDEPAVTFGKTMLSPMISTVEVLYSTPAASNPV